MHHKGTIGRLGTRRLHSLLMESHWGTKVDHEDVVSFRSLGAGVTYLAEIELFISS